MLKMKKLMVMLAVLCALFVQVAQAGLIKSYAYETTVFNGYAGGPLLNKSSNLLNRTLVANYITSSGSYNTQTWAGASQGSGNSTRFNGGFVNYSSSKINDIIISYTGNNQLRSNSVNGSVHVSNAVNVDGDTGVLASSFFGINLLVAGNRASSNLTGNDLINNLFTWSTNMNFLLNQAFSLEIDSRLRVQGGTQRSGYYKTALGGSPVFILPTGFSANSADGSIVDNYYVGYNPLAANTPSTPVPEPPTSILLLLAAGVFFFQLKKVHLENNI